MDTAAARMDLMDALANLTDRDHQVWVQTPQGGVYAYRTDLVYGVAASWANAWNTKTPEDVPAGTTFHVVKAVTSFTLD